MGMGVITGAMSADRSTALQGMRRYAALDEQEKANQEIFNKEKEVSRKNTIRSATTAGMSTGAAIGSGIAGPFGALAGSGIGAAIGYMASSGNLEPLYFTPEMSLFFGRAFDDLF